MGDKWLRYLHRFYPDAEQNASMVSAGPGGAIDGIAAGGEHRHIDLGFSSVQLSVRDSNVRATRFYENAGWSLAGRETDSSVRYGRTLEHALPSDAFAASGSTP